MREFRIAVEVGIVLLLTVPAWAEAVTEKQGPFWRIENESLRVTVDPAMGSLTVLDKRVGYEWRQPGSLAAAAPSRVVLRRVAPPPTVDGDPGEWMGEATIRLTFQMTADAKKVESDQDCSAEVWGGWDAACLYLAARVRDEELQFGPTGLSTWWERDALELWVGGRQVGLNLNPERSEAWTAEGPVPAARVVVRPGPGGYSVEAALPWKVFPEAPRPVPGSRFRFAVGVDDADATGAREGQLYFPATWVHSNPATFAEAFLADERGVVPPSAAEPLARFRGVRWIPGAPEGLAFEADFGATQGRPNTLTVSLRVPAGSSDLAIEADLPDRDVEWASSLFLEPFLLDTPQGVLAVADYSNGHLYPLDLNPFPQWGFEGGRLDMPWVGVCDLRQGMGYALILETSDDAWVQCRSYPMGDRQWVAPQVGWHPSKGRFAYARQLRYRFVEQGGYVALAKAYRAYAQAQGLVVPLAEKLKQNPNLHRLFGAPDVWGEASLAFARQAKAAGVDKMLLHGRSSAEEMKAINALGYLTSEYDNYTDILPVEAGQEIDSSHDQLPDHAVLMGDGKRMTAWLTWDRQTQYMKRCPARWMPTAQLVIPKVLREFPFLGRFIDVTTAEGLYECYDPNHPLTKAEKRQCGVDLLGYVRSQGLVVGGEHGIWWAVPVLDYIEGMMSGGYYSWPAGHLIQPKSKDEEFEGAWGKVGGPGAYENYARWGIGHEWRVPLWELVFHDCIVSTWYWGDASDFLLQAAPEVTPKKDAFNILYGTIPLLWANNTGSWQRDRAVFLRTYRNTCKLHEVLAGTEMLRHEFVTPDHAVQRTEFSDGTQVLVNFGEKPYLAQLGKEKYLLPQNGFAVKGPRHEQSLALVDGQPVTTIRQPGYLFTDAGGVERTLRAVGKDHLRLYIGSCQAPVILRPAEVVAGWEVASTRCFALDAQGERLHHVEARRAGRDGLRFGPFPQPMVLDLLCRSQAQRPDLRFAGPGPEVSPPQPKQGEWVQVTVALQNGGGAAAQGVEVVLWPALTPGVRPLAHSRVSLAPGETKEVAFLVDTSPLDGDRLVWAVIDPRGQVAELCSRNNRQLGVLRVTPDFSRWPHHRILRVEAGDLDRQDEPVVCPIELPGVDPASVRVAECDAQGHPQALIPAQFDASPGGRGELCFLLPGRTPARTGRRLVLLWAETTPGRASFLPPVAALWDAEKQAVEGETYRVEFRDGTLVNLAAKRQGIAGSPFLASLILSSQETGWGDEPGRVERFEVLHSGPVRTTVFVRKALRAGVVYEKTYTFYPRYFEVAISVNRPAGGLYSRAYYAQPGEYINDQGFRARVDGEGAGEEVYGQGKNPRWYAVYSGEWAHSCLALSPFDHIAYWDAGSYWGGIGFVTGETQNLRMRYVIHPGAADAAFAEEDYRHLVNPMAVVME